MIAGAIAGAVALIAAMEWGYRCGFRDGAVNEIRRRTHWRHRS